MSHFWQRMSLGLSALATGAVEGLPAWADDEAAAPTICAANAGGCVVLIAVQIDGASAIDPAAFSDLYEHLLARPIAPAALTALASQITNRYREKGYFLSQAIVPPQDFSSGLARIVVIEGRIDKVTIEGAAAHALTLQLTGSPKGSIADLGDLEAKLSRAGDIPGISLKTRVVPSLDDPASNELIVEASPKPNEIYAETNNRGAWDGGDWTGFSRYGRGGVFADRDWLNLSVATALEDPENFTRLSVDYRIALASGDQVSVAISGARSDITQNVPTLQSGGENRTLSLGYTRALKRQRNYGLYFDVSLDAAEFEQDWTNGGSYQDETRVARSVVRGFNRSKGVNLDYYVAASFGLDALGASGPSDSGRSRPEADASFFKLNGRVGRYQDLGKYVGVYVAVEGQWSNDPLLLSEQYALGGARIGRAYDYGELTGDRGLGGVVELRAGFDPAGDTVDFLQGYLFYDAGAVWFNDAPSTEDIVSLNSGGVGFRIDMLDGLRARLEVAKPLTRVPIQETDKDIRSFLTVSVFN